MAIGMEAWLWRVFKTLPAALLIRYPAAMLLNGAPLMTPGAFSLAAHQLIPYHGIKMIPPLLAPAIACLPAPPPIRNTPQLPPILTAIIPLHLLPIPFG